MPEAVDPEYAKFLDQLDKWLEEKAGISKSLLRSLDQDSDWAFIIKIHGIMEVALNHLIGSRLTAPELKPVIAQLETGHDRRGKIAFIQALDLLPENACLFVKLLSKLRGQAVHKIENFDLDLVKYLTNLNKSDQHAWKLALRWWSEKPIVEERPLDFIPRTRIHAACWTIVLKSFSESTYIDRFIEKVFPSPSKDALPDSANPTG